MAIEDKNNPDLIRGKGQLSGAGNDLISGKADPNTIQTYQTKSFNHEGVTGSEPVGRLNETNVAIAITPDVMIVNNSPVDKQVKDEVSKKPVGQGMSEDSGKVENQPHEKSQSAGNIGGSNVSHV